MLKFVRSMACAGAAVAVVFAAMAASVTLAQDRRQNRPGQFDFYVLALSWSPSFCEAAGERGTAPQPECGARPYAFVVHGLWPQYEQGSPEFCQQPAPRLERNIVSSMLDLIPASNLIVHEWEAHGTCSGLSPSAYFDTIRKVRAQMRIPEAYGEPHRPLTVTPDEVEKAFMAANPGLRRTAIAVTCDSRRMQEVRICVAKDGGFRDCPEVDRRACRRDRIGMPPVHSGN